MTYGFGTRVPMGYTDTVARVRAALKEQGFGVLTEIDVKSTLHEKIGVTMEDYVILGACNPPLAHRALEGDREVGLLLPCNVVVRADGPDATLVQVVDPEAMFQLSDRADLKPVAEQAAALLRAAVDSLGGTSL